VDDVDGRLLTEQLFLEEKEKYVREGTAGPLLARIQESRSLEKDTKRFTYPVAARKQVESGMSSSLQLGEGQ
jgi:hypothetical protein